MKIEVVGCSMRCTSKDHPHHLSRLLSSNDEKKPEPPCVRAVIGEKKIAIESAAGA